MKRGWIWLSNFKVVLFCVYYFSRNNKLLEAIGSVTYSPRSDFAIFLSCEGNIQHLEKNALSSHMSFDELKLAGIKCVLILAAFLAKEWMKLSKVGTFELFSCQYVSGIAQLLMVALTKPAQRAFCLCVWVYFFSKKNKLASPAV